MFINSYGITSKVNVNASFVNNKYIIRVSIGSNGKNKIKNLE